MRRTGVRVERDLSSDPAEGLLHFLDVPGAFVRVLLGEVAEEGCPRLRILGLSGPVEQDDGGDVLRKLFRD